MNPSTDTDRGLVLKNSTANFLGQLTNKVVRILLVPVQIKLLGDQAFGLLGFYALVAGFVAFLDLGLSLTANREVARLSAGPMDSRAEVRDLVRTFEIPYWTLGLALGATLTVSAEWFAEYWISAPGLPRGTVVFAVQTIGILLAARWPVGLYRSIVFGLQYQVKANILGIGIELANGAGSLLLLLVYPDVKAYFVWQLILGMLEILGYVLLTWYLLSAPNCPLPRFRLNIFRRVWQFALGVNAVSIITAVFGRADGLILSKMYPINYLGYYSLALRVPALLGIFPASTIPATTPALVMQYERHEAAGMSQLYHLQMRWLSFISVGVSGALSAFAYPILLLWTQSSTVALAATASFALISVGAALEVMTNPVNQLSLACGFTRPPIVVNAVAGIAIAGGTLVLAPRLGITGAAVAWCSARVLMYFIFPISVHRQVLPSELKTWFTKDTLPFLAVAGLTFALSAYLYERTSGLFDGLLWLPLLAIAGGIYILLVLAFRLLPPTGWVSNLLRQRKAALRAR